MRLSELQNKDIVNIESGKNIGRIVDVLVNSAGQIEALLIEERNNFPKLFRTSSDLEVSFKNIVKFGEDVILVKM